MDVRRSVLLPGECYDDFLMAMVQAKINGTPEREFRMQRLRMNGWTEQIEQGFIGHLASAGKLTQLGPRE